MLEHPAHCGVARLVKCNGPLLPFGDELVLFLQAAHDAVYGIQEILFAHLACIASCRNQGRFVANVGDVSAAETRGLTGKEVDINRVVFLQWAQVHIKNGFPLLEVRHVHINLAIESAGTHQSAVQNIGPVRGRKDDHTTVGAKTIHLGQQLIQRVFALVVGSHARVFATGTANGIDLIDKDDARTLVLGLLEQVPDAACAYTHKHLHEIRATERKEWHLRLPRHSFGHQGFACARRPHEQSALGNLGAKVRVFVGILEELHNLG